MVHSLSVILLTKENQRSTTMQQYGSFLKHDVVRKKPAQTSTTAIIPTVQSTKTGKIYLGLLEAGIGVILRER